MPSHPPSSVTHLPSPEAPIIQGHPSTYQVEPPGSDALLDCDARGHPAPLVRWSKDGVPVGTGGHLHQLQNGSLAIRGVGVSGVWGCWCVLGSFHGKAKNGANTVGIIRVLTQGTTDVWQRMTQAQRQRLSPWPCRVSAVPLCTPVLRVCKSLRPSSSQITPNPWGMSPAPLGCCSTACISLPAQVPLQ